MKRISLLACFCGLAFAASAGQPYADRFVWVFGWGLGKDADVTEISKVIETAGQHGFNGAVLSSGLDTLCQQSADYFRRLREIQRVCERNKMELIPAIFSIGYGGGVLSHNRNLVEGVPVEDAPFLVKGGEARLESREPARIVNGGFEDYTGNSLKGFDFHDQPGEVSYVDTEVKHGDQASLRLEHFNANPHGHGRVMQTVKLQPRRCYRLTLWVKTEGLEPASAFQVLALAENRELAPRQFHLQATGDWRKTSMLFNSLNCERVRLYAGVWGGKSGKLWLDDWSLEETGPVNVLHRAGTPVTVRSDDASVTYQEGKDYGPLGDANFRPWRDDSEPAPLRIPAGSGIHEGQHLRVSWYHSMVIHDSQVTVCMAEPEVYEIFDHEARLLAERLHPRRVMLNMDEIRMGGTCRVCRGQDMGELLGRCIARQIQAIRKAMPGAQVYAWSDMLDPNHNAHGNYYLVEGDFTGSWQHVPKDLIMAVWGGAPREKSLRFFHGQGFATLAACYYDADDLNETKDWLRVARALPTVRGFMYTPWQKKYALLPAFGDLLRE